jgi:hypothetical protein
VSCDLRKVVNEADVKVNSVGHSEMTYLGYERKLVKGIDFLALKGRG